MSDGQPPRPDERLDNLTGLVALKVLPALRSQDIRTSAISTLLWVVLWANIILITLSTITLWAVLGMALNGN
jgi:hypothetical protein